MEARTPHHKTKIGIVTGIKMDKSVSVIVVRHAMHPVYGKRVVKSKKFLVHDGENACRVGDRIQFVETRPISKNKRWKLVKIIERAPILGGTVDEEA